VVSRARTIRRRLEEVGIFGSITRKKPLLTVQHKRKCLA